MAGIDAEGDSLGLMDVLANHVQMRKVVPKVGSRADRGFKTGDGLVTRKISMYSIKCLGDSLESDHLLL